MNSCLQRESSLFHDVHVCRYKVVTRYFSTLMSADVQRVQLSIISELGGLEQRQRVGYVCSTELWLIVCPHILHVVITCMHGACMYPVVSVEHMQESSFMLRE